MSKVIIKNANGAGIVFSEVVYFPKDFDKSNKYLAIIITHPGGCIKEQTTGLYAQKMAAVGQLVTIAFDASYQGESTGETRQLENPYIRTEDISAVLII